MRVGFSTGVFLHLKIRRQEERGPKSFKVFGKYEDGELVFQCHNIPGIDKSTLL